MALRWDRGKRRHIPEDEGTQAGRDVAREHANTKQLQRHAFCTVSIIKEVNILVAKQPHEAGCIGSPRVIEQMLAAIQRHIKALLGEAWKMAAPRQIVPITEKMYKFCIDAQHIWALGSVKRFF